MNNYAQIDRLLHQLVQPLARFGRSFVESKEDDSHTNLQLDALSNSISTRWSPNGYRLVLRLNSWQYELIDRDAKSVLSLPIQSNLNQTESLLNAKIDKMLGESSYGEPLHYDIPIYDFGTVQTPVAQDIELWMNYRLFAQQMCYALITYFEVDAAVRIWPHHFDTGIFFYPNKKLGIGFGWAMKDELLEEPYFYMTGYPALGVLDFSTATYLEVGKWLNNNSFKGAVLTFSEISDLNNGEKQKTLSQFMLKASSWYLNQV